MKLRVLGCSGGISEGLKTTSLLVNDKILVDAGTGIGDLPLDTLKNIRTIFVTHSHLDHICGIPLLVDTIFDYLDQPLVVYGGAETIKALREHVFNNVIWPDFTCLPTKQKPVLSLQVIEMHKTITIDGIDFETIPVNHVVPACGYRLTHSSGVIAFSGDTTTNDSFWDALNRGPALNLLIVEAAFPNADLELCKLARHYCPSLLAEDLKKLKHNPKIYLTHSKPGAEAEIFAECRALIPERDLKQLVGGEIFQI